MRKKISLVASLAFAVALSAGIAGANVNAKAETNWSDFEISATAIRTASPAGLRFKVDCPVDYSANEEVEAWTNISFTSDVEGTERSYSTNIPVKCWRDASGWNAVLLEIPASDYATEITAQAFVKVDGTTYQTGAVTFSIAKTAATLMNGGETAEEVTKYTAGAVTNITLSEATATITSGESKKLTATTAPADYAVVWSSDNEAVATVAADGTVKALKAGTANVTATMSGVTATCAVTVNWADKYTFENGVNPVVIDTSATKATGFAEVATNNKALAMSTSHDSYLALDKDWLAAMFADESVKGIAFDVYTTLDGFATHNRNGETVNNFKDVNGRAYYTTESSNAAAGSPTWQAKAAPKQNGFITMTFTKGDYTNWLSANGSVDGVNALALLLRFGNIDTVSSENGDGQFAYKYANPVTISIDNVRAFRQEAREKDMSKADGTFNNGVNAIVGAASNTYVAGMAEIGEGNKAVQLYTSSGNDVYLAISMDYLATGFENGKSYITYKVYTAMDGVGGYNGSASSTLSQYTRYFWQDTSGTLKAYGWNNYGVLTSVGKMCTFKIEKAKYDALKAQTDIEYMVVMLRFGINDDDNKCIYGLGSTKKITTVYVDDFLFN